MFELFNIIKNIFIPQEEIPYSKKKDEDNSSHDCESDSDNENENENLLSVNRRNRIYDIVKRDKEESLIVDPINVELTLKKEKPHINILSSPGASFEIRRHGTDCYMSENVFYNEFINRVSYFPEFRKATSITWPACVPQGQTSLFSRQMEYISLDLIHIYHGLCKRTNFSKNVLQFIEESLKEDTPWIIIRLPRE